jgi:nicotinate-nucleotide--dimethylbenzimidazole phosphoribosyltransferase
MIARIVESNEGLPGEFVEGRDSATQAERPSAPLSSPDELANITDSMFPSTSVAISQPPPPEDDRTEVRFAPELLAAVRGEPVENLAITRVEGVPFEEPEENLAITRVDGSVAAEELAREAQRRAELAAAERFAREHTALPSMIVDASVSRPSEPEESEAARAATRPTPTPGDSVLQERVWSASPVLSSSTPVAAPAYRASTSTPPASPAFATAPAGIAEAGFATAANRADQVPDTDNMSRKQSVAPAGKRSPIVPALVLLVVVMVAAFVAMRGQPADEPDQAQPQLAQQDPGSSATPLAAATGVAEPGVAEPGVAEPGVAEPGVAQEAAAPGAVLSAPAPAAEVPAPAAPVAAAAVPPTADTQPVAPTALAPSVSVQVRTNPRTARISVDGRPFPDAEPTLKLPPGVPVKLRASATGRLPEERELVPDAQTRVVRFNLVAMPFMLRVTTTPPGARVVVGKKAGDSPMDIPLGESVLGPVEVSARLSGYRFARVMVPLSAYVERGDTMLAEVKLNLVPVGGGAVRVPAVPASRRVVAPAVSPDVQEPKAPEPAVEAPAPAEVAPAPSVVPEAVAPAAEPAPAVPNAETQPAP